MRLEHHSGRQKDAERKRNIRNEEDTETGLTFWCDDPLPGQNGGQIFERALRAALLVDARDDVGHGGRPVLHHLGARRVRKQRQVILSWPEIRLE